MKLLNISVYPLYGNYIYSMGRSNVDFYDYRFIQDKENSQNGEKRRGRVMSDLIYKFNVV